MNDSRDIMKQKAIFRKMRFPEDQELLYAIHRSYDKEYGLDRDPEEYKIQMGFYSINTTIYHPMILLIGDQPAGYIRGYDRISMSSCDIVLMLDLVYIMPEFRGMGFGRIMMEKFIEFGQIKKVARIDLLTDLDNESAVSLYKSLGFKGRNRHQMICFIKDNKELEEYFEKKKQISG
ncbi:GNAT family N-acetyltransferase [bacterium]|nr:GNAT family N-acetyltransferase [candidate division CSSED10-310 bacterium]